MSPIRVVVDLWLLVIKCHSSASNKLSIKPHIIGAGEVTIHAEVPFVVAHRHAAGNFATGTLLVKHSAAAKLRKAVLRGWDHVTLEKHIYPLKMVIFHSYVSLPEGNGMANIMVNHGWNPENVYNFYKKNPVVG